MGEAESEAEANAKGRKEFKGQMKGGGKRGKRWNEIKDNLLWPLLPIDTVQPGEVWRVI